MKITKFVHSCLLVETPERIALFDPGVYSAVALDIDKLTRLDDIFITHEHGDHFDPELVSKLVQKFPQARITSTAAVVAQLAQAGIKAANNAPTGTTFFDSPHESMAPMQNPPQAIGVHYLNALSHPGDSHSFTESKTILALPVTAQWGSSARAVKLALELKPKYILPIHDWHWHEEARELMYEKFEKFFAGHSIQFFKLKTGQPIEINL